MHTKIIGWDIGGAHVKAALLDENGQILQVLQQPCPLWKGIDHLHQAMAAILQAIPAGQYLNAVTMTGELVDCFASREQGVQAIIQAVHQQLNAHDLTIYAGRRGFLSLADITANEYMNIASANWLASGDLAAKQQAFGLFVDVGSTTTDILLLEDHQVQAQGYSDYQRLVSGELLYTGIVRTAVMAIAQRAIFNGQEMGLMAEYFATMADVYRLTGDLQEAHDQADTADGGEKTAKASAIRLSRMTGYEFAESDWSLWLDFAQQLKQQQKQLITKACLQQIQRSQQAEQLVLVGAGVGRFLVKQIAAEQGLQYQDFAEIFQQTTHGEIDANDCAPAVAVAYLAGGFC